METEVQVQTDNQTQTENQLTTASDCIRQLKKYRIIVWLLAVLCIGMLTAGAAVVYYAVGVYQDILEKNTVMAADFEEKLENAQDKIAGLEKIKTELEEQTSVIKLEDADGKLSEIEKIPFAVDLDAWNYLLVNEINPLNEGFTVDLVRFSAGQYVDRRIKNRLDDMFADAKEAGLHLMVCSSYREIKKQDQLMDSAIKRYIKRGMTYTEAFYEAKEQIAQTGASEHHTGLAVDIVGVGHQQLDRAQADTPEAVWLNEHAAEYGFILRFPADKEEITGIAFESWHFRYVGEEAAVYMKEKNLCLEEFIAIAQLQQGIASQDRININMKSSAK